MTLVKIDKKSWAEGLTAAADTYRLFGPVKEKDYHQFKALEKGEMPDLDMVNTRLSPKALLFPQSEEMLEYSLDESRDDHHIMKAVPQGQHAPRRHRHPALRCQIDPAGEAELRHAGREGPLLAKRLPRHHLHRHGLRHAPVHLLLHHRRLRALP
jgi:hypothetical protein